MMEIEKVILDPTVWLLVCVCILLCFKIVRKTNFFNVTQIIKKHLEAFRDEEQGKYNKIQFSIAFIIPGIIAISISSIKIIDTDTINILTVIISILTSMFFTLLALILDIKTRWDEKKGDSSEYSVIKKLLQSLYYAIMFEILISICLLILCFLAVFIAKFTWIQSFFIYWFSIMLIMNMLMMLKRIFLVIERTMK